MLYTNFSILLNCRKARDNTLQGTTWQIKFEVGSVVQESTYKLRVAIASATLAELQVKSLGSLSLSHTHTHIHARTHTRTITQHTSFLDVTCRFYSYDCADLCALSVKIRINDPNARRPVFTTG